MTDFWEISLLIDRKREELSRAEYLELLEKLRDHVDERLEEVNSEIESGE